MNKHAELMIFRLTKNATNNIQLNRKSAVILEYVCITKPETQDQANTAQAL